VETEVNGEIGVDKQRIYDAMLIKAFRQDVTVGVLWNWLRVYGIDVPEKNLKRQPKTNKMRVQAFVGCYLKPLADRLWDTDRSKDLETLDWMTWLDTQLTKNNDDIKLKRQSNRDRRRSGLIAQSLQRHNRGNQWGVTK
jgi:hypothetical protein